MRCNMATVFADAGRLAPRGPFFWWTVARDERQR